MYLINLRIEPYSECVTLVISLGLRQNYEMSDQFFQKSSLKSTRTTSDTGINKVFLELYFGTTNNGKSKLPKKNCQKGLPIAISNDVL